MIRFVFLLVIAASIAIPAKTSLAQLFGGKRQLGSPHVRQAGSGNHAEVGKIRGNERFIRGNRDRRSFVGTDSTDAADFVGMEQASGSNRVQSTLSGMRIRTGEDVNRRVRAATEQRRAMYDPRLQVDFTNWICLGRWR